VARRFGFWVLPVLQRPDHRKMIQRVDAWDVRRLTGEFDSDFWRSTVKMGNVAGTDLGHMFDMDGQLYMVFGDSFGVGSLLPPDNQPGPRPDWRSNTMAVIYDWSAFWYFGLNKAYMITDRPGHAKELIPGNHEPNDGQGEVTKIPTNGIAVNGRMFLHYMSVKQWHSPGTWATNYSALAYSDDKGQTWHPFDPLVVPGVLPSVTGVVWPWNSNFAQVAFVREGGYVYLFGIRSGRHGGVKLARVPAGKYSPLNPGAYRYFKRVGTQSSWVTSEFDASTIVHGPVGELSVMYNEYLNRWTMMHIHPGFAGAGGKDAIVVREAPDLAGNWSEPTLVCVDGYGSFMHPFLVENHGETVYFTMSRWFAKPGDDQHYNVHLMKARFTKN
jgi:hypothetical protein